MITATLYTREDCSLCDRALEILESIQPEYPHKLVLIDIDQEEALLQSYGERVPVLEVGPYTLSAPFTAQEIKITMGAAQDRVGQLEEIMDVGYQKAIERKQKVTSADRIAFWFSVRYIWVFNIIVFVYLALPFLAPVLMNAGITGPARIIYRAYGAVCHQLSFRSWFLFGEQIAYPRAVAGVPELDSFESVTGLDSEDLVGARSFIGDERLGYKVAFCERDVATYSGILLFGLVFLVSQRKIPALPWYLWIALGIVPIALDGFSQLLSQPPFIFWAYRESTPLLRSLTGGLFGFATAWFGYPQLEISMRDTRRILLTKFARFGVQK